MNLSDDITIRVATNDDCEKIKSLVFSVLREYGLTPEPDATDADIADIENSYIKPGGIFEVLEDGEGNLCGTVGLHPMDENTIELRKMYLAKEIRGRGLGKKVLARMIETARELGFKKLYLETASPLKEAIGLYEKFGFKQTNVCQVPRCDRAFTYELR
jgi:putative acetyltransferase